MATLRDVAAELGIPVSYNAATDTVTIAGKNYKAGTIPGTSYDPSGTHTVTNREALKAALGITSAPSGSTPETGIPRGYSPWDYIFGTPGAPPVASGAPAAPAITDAERRAALEAGVYRADGETTVARVMQGIAEGATRLLAGLGSIFGGVGQAVSGVTGGLPRLLSVLTDAMPLILVVLLFGAVGKVFKVRLNLGGGRS